MRKTILISLVILLGIVPLSGCNLFTNWAHSKDYKPLIVVPRRPQLDKLPVSELKSLAPDAQKALKIRDAKLKDSIERHRDVIEVYNMWAKRQNVKNGFGEVTLIQEEER